MATVLKTPSKRRVSHVKENVGRFTVRIAITVAFASAGTGPTAVDWPATTGGRLS